MFDLQEYERTDAGLRVRRRPTPCLYIAPAFYDEYFDTGSTSSSYDPCVIYAGTSASFGGLITPRRNTAQDILEIRFLSGLTWEELAELFGVSRRSVHNWANGGPMKPENITLVRHVLWAIKELRRESSVETRLALLTPLPWGERPLDLLRARRWLDAIAAVRALPRISVPPYSFDAPHPTTYFGALTDSAPTSGQVIPGRSRRIPRKKS